MSLNGGGMGAGTVENVAGEGTLSGWRETQFRISRRFTKKGIHPFDEITWELRDAEIKGANGELVFSQKGVEVPAFWSQSATNIFASKYFRGKVGTAEREWSVKQAVSRVVRTIVEWGRNGSYFVDNDEAEAFEAELIYLLVNQYASFNSPVWFNFGIERKPQGSACFINSVKDDMRSILNLAVTEGMLFKHGSGTGTNFSALRSSKEFLSGGGRASGPVSFMKGYDAFAGVVKSGGKTRRAAKIAILNVDHPDIMEFIECKAKEEDKARKLIELGYDGSIDGDVYTNTFFQNTNNSVRVTDEFMRAVRDDGMWQTRYITNGEVCETMRARDVMRAIADATWRCGDPGVQFDTTTNRWHTCPHSGRINASNPCGEFVFLDDSACNLASLNLMRFYDSERGVFDTESFKHAVGIMLTAQEILVSNVSYPTEAIERNSHDFRPLGLGYANLGALLMANGLPYDSDEGRNYAAAVTALMTGYAYYVSACLAQRKGPFKFFKKNKAPLMNVIAMHVAHARKLNAKGVPIELTTAANDAWTKAQAAGRRYGYRNAQVTLLAPTGTIGFIMDCDTTGIEPEIALVKYKWLVGGGMMKIVNGTVRLALKRLNYSDEQIDEILRYLEESGTIEGAPHLKTEHLAVFDCAFKPANGKRFIHYLGHIKMMAAVQPFLSGAISKTVNMPKEATVEDVMDAYIQAWQLGLKSITIYRDGSKGVQPLTTSKEEKSTQKEKEAVVVEVRKPIRRKLPPERQSITHRFDIAGHVGYLTVGIYEDGTPGEIFITMSKQGSTISGVMDAFATSVSIALQYGVPLKTLIKKFIHTRYEPAGITDNPQIRIAKSITDYIFRWMALKFLSREEQIEVGVNVDLHANSRLDSFFGGEETYEGEERTAEAKTQYERQSEPSQIKQIKATETITENITENLTERKTSIDNSAMTTSTAMSTTTSTTSITTDGGVGGVNTHSQPHYGQQHQNQQHGQQSQTQYTTQTTQEIQRTQRTPQTFTFQNSEDAPACPTCGSIMVRNGACYKCMNCGTTSGCS